MLPCLNKILLPLITYSCFQQKISAHNLTFKPQDLVFQLLLLTTVQTTCSPFSSLSTANSFPSMGLCTCFSLDLDHIPLAAPYEVVLSEQKCNSFFWPPCINVFQPSPSILYHILSFLIHHSSQLVITWLMHLSKFLRISLPRSTPGDCWLYEGRDLLICLCHSQPW